jgi:hypothetical protein
MGAAPPSRTSIYGFLSAGRIFRVGRIKENQRGERWGASRNTRLENRRAF